MFKTPRHANIYIIHCVRKIVKIERNFRIKSWSVQEDPNRMIGRFKKELTSPLTMAIRLH